MLKNIVFLRVRFSNCDTVERCFEIVQFCDGKVSIYEGYNNNKTIIIMAWETEGVEIGEFLPFSCQCTGIGEKDTQNTSVVGTILKCGISS